MNSGGSAVGFIIYLIVCIAFYVAFAYPLMVIGNKRGLTGWFAWVPILNWILILQIADKPLWWFILFLLPIVNLVFAIIVTLAFLEAIDQPKVWVLAILFFPLFLIPLFKAANE